MNTKKIQRKECDQKMKFQPEKPIDTSHEAAEVKAQLLPEYFAPDNYSVQVIDGYAEPDIDKNHLQIKEFAVLQNNLRDCLKIIDDEVMKGYITKLNSMDVIPFNDNGLKDIQFFRITELVHEKNEFSVHKLATVFHTLSNKACTVALMIQGIGGNTCFYLGVRSNSSENSSATMKNLLEQSFRANFPGSDTEAYRLETMNEDFDKIKVGCISSTTCVADFKQHDREMVTNDDFIQGIEKFVNAMKGKNYTAVIIADSISNSELMDIKREYENIYSNISPFADMQFAFNSSEGSSVSQGESSSTGTSYTQGTQHTDNSSVSKAKSDTVGKSVTDGIVDTVGANQSISDGTAKTTGTADTTSESTSRSHTTGTSHSSSNSVSVGVDLGVFNAGCSHSSTNSRFSSDTTTHTVGKSHTKSFSESISQTLTKGTNDSHAKSVSNTQNSSSSNTLTDTVGVSDGTSNSVSDNFSFVNSQTLTDNFGTTKGITLNAKNKTLTDVLDKLERHLERINECESIGMWDCAAYFLGECSADTETAANTYYSLMSGAQSSIERSVVNTWTDPVKVNELEKYIKRVVHPCFEYDGIDAVSIVRPTAMVSSNELALHLGLPKKSVKGLAVVEHAAFAQEVLCKNESEDKTFSAGNVYHLSDVTETEVPISIESLKMHTFVTGSTGSGKSNTVYHILDKLMREGIPFLVIEPAKGEYRKVFGAKANIFDTDPRRSNLLKINPFSFPEKMHILEHIERLIEIFNVCWPMYAAMPAVLKDAVSRSYEAAGWDLDLSVNTKVQGLFPTFDDVLRELHNVINSSEYSGDTKSDYIGSLSTRIKSLTNGINGRIFDGNEIKMSDLFDRNAIIDISKIGSSETKSLIMGILVLKLQEYRNSAPHDMNEALKHITVLEEAHNLLKKTSTEQNQESSNVKGKSVEMLSNAIAEMRTYGEGFIIVDQAPNMLDTAVIRNTNTKFVLRLPELKDREITGGAMALKEDQIAELSKLETGVAAVYQNNWQEAVLCKVHHFVPDYDFKAKADEDPYLINEIDNRDILRLLIKSNLNESEAASLRVMILRSKVSAKIKKDLICNFENKNLTFEWAVADFISKCFKCEGVFRGTGNNEWNGELSLLSKIAVENIRSEFEGFDDNEMKKILYFICRTQHELYPNNAVIEELRVEYLKKELM